MSTRPKRASNGFVVPLIPAVVGWFRELQPLACGSRYVLPARRIQRARDQGEDAPFEQRSLNAMLHKLCDQLGERCRRFIPHDLRSTARSWLAAIGVASGGGTLDGVPAGLRGRADCQRGSTTARRLSACSRA